MLVHYGSVCDTGCVRMPECGVGWRVAGGFECAGSAVPSSCWTATAATRCANAGVDPVAAYKQLLVGRVVVGTDFVGCGWYSQPNLP
jgi:hypothetical protein